MSQDSTLRGTQVSFFERSLLEPNLMPTIGTSEVTPTAEAVGVALPLFTPRLHNHRIFNPVKWLQRDEQRQQWLSPTEGDQDMVSPHTHVKPPLLRRGLKDTSHGRSWLPLMFLDGYPCLISR